MNNIYVSYTIIPFHSAPVRFLGLQMTRSGMIDPIPNYHVYEDKYINGILPFITRVKNLGFMMFYVPVHTNLCPIGTADHQRLQKNLQGQETFLARGK